MIAEFIRAEVERGLKAALQPASLFLRELSLGAMLVMLAGGLGLLGIIAFTTAAYLGLLTVMSPAMSALVLGAAALLVMLIVLLAGLSRLRPPR